MRNRALFLLDGILLALAVVAAYVIRFEGWTWLADRSSSALLFLAIIVPLKLLVFASLGLYRRLWRYASVSDLGVLGVASAASASADLLVGIAALPAIGLLVHRIPVGVLAIDALLTPMIIVAPRLSLRLISVRMRGRAASQRKRALIVGAGAAGGMIAKELIENPQLGIVPAGFIDDDIRKHSHRLHNVPVVGAIADLKLAVQRFDVDEVIIAIPSAHGRVLREIVQRCADAGVPTRTVPGLYEILSGAKSVSALRQIEIQDLLRREPIRTDLDEVAGLIRDQTVLVTGAGGSIGSELCRQIAQLRPARLVAVGRGENSIFELAQELRHSFPDLVLDAEIADVRDEVRLRRVFRKTKPFSVFHAAAHKHVPLMERHVEEAILNNVLGTFNVAENASAFDVEHLVLVSTDKAVRPTSIMGATKRISEATVHLVAGRDRRKYVSVRFGNVLGSRGSVVPTFMRQIAAGGPITITHPEMRRYFMTIPEAVQLVLQAGAMARGGEVFVLDMGDPVRIVDLATDLIRLSGLEAHTDIEIRFTGVRPGEKLYEELFFSRDVAEPTTHAKILRARDSQFDQRCTSQIEALVAAAKRCAPEMELRSMIQEIVPEYALGQVSDDAAAVDELMHDRISVSTDARSLASHDIVSPLALPPRRTSRPSDPGRRAIVTK